MFKWQMKKLKKMQEQMIDMQSEMLDKNQEKLTKIANQSADITSEAITKGAKAVKKDLRILFFVSIVANQLIPIRNFVKNVAKNNNNQLGVNYV